MFWERLTLTWFCLLSCLQTFTKLSALPNYFVYTPCCNNYSFYDVSNAITFSYISNVCLYTQVKSSLLNSSVVLFYAINLCIRALVTCQDPDARSWTRYIWHTAESMLWNSNSTTNEVKSVGWAAMTETVITSQLRDDMKEENASLDMASKLPVLDWRRSHPQLKSGYLQMITSKHHFNVYSPLMYNIIAYI